MSTEFSPDLLDQKGRVKVGVVAERVQRVLRESALPIDSIELRSWPLVIESSWMIDKLQVPAAYRYQNAQWRIIVMCSSHRPKFESRDFMIIEAQIEIRTKYRSQDRFKTVHVAALPGAYTGVT